MVRNQGGKGGGSFHDSRFSKSEVNVSWILVFALHDSREIRYFSNT